MSWERHPRSSKSKALIFNTVITADDTKCRLPQPPPTTQIPRKKTPRAEDDEEKRKYKKKKKEGTDERSDEGERGTPPPAAAAAGSSPRKKLISANMPEEVKALNDTQSWDFEYVRTNVFVCRKKADPPMCRDQAPVCSCPRIDGEPGCAAMMCLNRMTNVECIAPFCPCGETCSNQRFQRREYAAVAPFKTARKGWGLMALEDISPGQFVIEYVGEVIDSDELECRLSSSVAAREGGHMYFLTLTGDEAIDASRKGNLARFINHSCEPNCMTVKWQVLGELCVGIFAKEHIRAGSELSFDYHFQRFGAFKQQCFCGAPSCRQWLGEPPPQRSSSKPKKLHRTKSGSCSPASDSSSCSSLAPPKEEEPLPSSPTSIEPPPPIEPSAERPKSPLS